MELNEVKKIIKYWQKTAEHDYATMIGLFKIKRYSDSLFFGHIVLEKILKAHVVDATKKEPPYIHDLARLCVIGNLALSKDEIDLLNIVNDFNIRCRYPEHKLSFYKKCTREYTEKYLDEIIKLYKKLCQEIKLKT